MEIITIAIILNYNIEVIITSIHTGCDGRKRRDLLASLTAINYNVPWLVVGGFNVMREKVEKLGETQLT